MQVNIALLTVTDTRTIDTDKSGAILVKKIKEQNHKLIERKIVKDKKDKIKEILSEWIKKENLDVIITTGGTGLTGRDSTPEAISEIAEKIIEGFGELFRQISFLKIGTSAIQSRALGALIKGTYVFSIPGSTSDCKDAWDNILKFQLDNRYRPCNFIEIMPRLQE